jgi:hypothetical protein
MPNVLRILAYVLIGAYCVAIMALPFTKRYSHLNRGAKTAFWVAGMMGIAWVAIAAQESFRFVELSKYWSHMLPWIRSISAGAAIGLLLGITFFGGFKVSRS